VDVAEATAEDLEATRETQRKELYAERNARSRAEAALRSQSQKVAQLTSDVTEVEAAIAKSVRRERQIQNFVADVAVDAEEMSFCQTDMMNKQAAFESLMREAANLMDHLVTVDEALESALTAESSYTSPQQPLAGPRRQDIEHTSVTSALRRTNPRLFSDPHEATSAIPPPPRSDPRRTSASAAPNVRLAMLETDVRSVRERLHLLLRRYHTAIAAGSLALSPTPSRLRDAPSSSVTWPESPRTLRRATRPVASTPGLPSRSATRNGGVDVTLTSPTPPSQSLQLNDSRDSEWDAY